MGCLSVGSLVAVLVLSAMSNGAELPKVPPETQRLYEAYQAKYKNPNSSDPKLVSNLVAAADSDLCFLDCVSKYRNAHDYVWLTARDQLAKLNTQRTFDVLLATMRSPPGSGPRQ